MKKSIIIIVLLAIIGGVAWYYTRGNPTPVPETETPQVENPTSLTQTAGGLSVYKNEELGLSVKYPTAWTAETSPSGALFSVPFSEGTPGVKKNTLAKLQVNIDVIPGKCLFPQVSLIKEKDTIKVSDKTFNMIAMSTASQGHEYFNRMYSMENGSVCYSFTFSAISSNPASKSLTPAQVTEVTANNKAIIASADLAFKEMIKTYAPVIGEAGENEALHNTSTSTK